MICFATENKLTQTFATANPNKVIIEVATCCVSKLSETSRILCFLGVLHIFSTPWKMNGWNLQTTICLKGK